MRLLLIALLSLLPLPVLADMPAPEGRVMVTVGGNLPSGNMEPSGEADPDYFGYMEIYFKNAVGFDDAMLAGLEQGRITLPRFGRWTDVTFTGPYLSAVLAAAGASERGAIPMAMDGYRAEISWDNITALRPILATHANGRPLDLGGYGPAAIIYPPQKDAALREELETLQVWAVVFIGVD